MKSLKEILNNKIPGKSVWFMRQAGRYLPEFRKIRLENTDFIKLCLNSELSSLITLQPIDRFNLDSAIIFSDILMIPYALGQEVNFVKNEGPELNKFINEKLLENNEVNFSRTLEPVYKAINITRRKLDSKKSLICFVGAPWTLLVYMLNLREDKLKVNLTKLKSIKNQEIDAIINVLVNFICIHIKNQINAGADVVQIFDSWAGIIPNDRIEDYCFSPNKRIVDFCKKNKIISICFPRGIKEKYKQFNNIVKPDGLNIDYDLNPEWAKSHLKNVVLQGGLNPKALLEPDKKMFEEATKYIKTFNDIPYIFNLGHGLLPETDPDKLKKLINFYRKY